MAADDTQKFNELYEKCADKIDEMIFSFQREKERERERERERENCVHVDCADDRRFLEQKGLRGFYASQIAISQPRSWTVWREIRVIYVARRKRDDTTIRDDALRR